MCRVFLLNFFVPKRRKILHQISLGIILLLNKDIAKRLYYIQNTNAKYKRNINCKLNPPHNPMGIWYLFGEVPFFFFKYFS